MATATGSNMITLTSSDGVDITIEREVAERSILIKNMLEDLGDSGEAIPIPNVSDLSQVHPSKRNILRQIA